MIKREISRKKYLLLSFLGFFSFFLLWFILSSFNIIPSFFLPKIHQVFNSTVRLFTESDFLIDISVSIYRIISGFVLSVLIAVPLGILVGTIKKVEALIEPIVAFIRYVPPSAFVPLSILWFGIGEIEKLFIIFIGVTPYLLILTADVVANVKNEYIEAGYTLGANTHQIYREIIFPASLPGIWDAMRLMIGAAWTFIILVEIIASNSGLGHVIIQSQRYLQTANIFTVIILLGLLGLLTDYAFKYGYKKLFPWAEKIR